MSDVIKLMQAQPGFCSLKGVPDEQIKLIEQVLNLKLAEEYREYIAIFGVASFACHELTGACDSKRLSVVDVTIKERNKVSVPNDWYVLEQTNINDIVIWQNVEGIIYQTMPMHNPKKLCDSLSEYLTI